MFSVTPCELPDNALLRTYLVDGGHADCYSTQIEHAITHEAFVEAFYSTGVFEIERFILRLLLNKPSTTTEAKQLAMGTSDQFAAWRVEERARDQLLLADMTGRTRSWLMVAPAMTGVGSGTRLLFGSAVVPAKNRKSGQSSLGPLFSGLLGFHKLYSQVLLAAARSRLSSKYR